ncbi:virB8 family protein (plasmid) [Photobacterium leiognathi subsp. mandapamensis]|uniref:virB8 family protein n=1 Tax=Photobacterium leiognathi TaxID=553611 RepID=UPI003AF3D970
MPLNKKEQDAIFGDALDFEASKSVMAEKSEHRAWTITKVSCALTVLSWVALALLMPLKTVVPYIAMVDKNSGQTQLLTVIDSNTLSAQTAINEYWIANYLRWREVYDWYTLQNDYDMTVLFSMPNVAQEYAQIFDGDNALNDKWGKRIKANIKILSIVNNDDNQIATVRFEKTIKNVDDKNHGKTSVWIATIGYDYLPDNELSETDRLKNPLGFKVTSYRVDPELIQ